MPPVLTLNQAETAIRGIVLRVKDDKAKNERAQEFRDWFLKTFSENGEWSTGKWKRVNDLHPFLKEKFKQYLSELETHGLAFDELSARLKVLEVVLQVEPGIDEWLKKYGNESQLKKNRLLSPHDLGAIFNIAGGARWGVSMVRSGYEAAGREVLQVLNDFDQAFTEMMRRKIRLTDDFYQPYSERLEVAHESVGIEVANERSRCMAEYASTHRPRQQPLRHASHYPAMRIGETEPEEVAELSLGHRAHRMYFS